MTTDIQKPEFILVFDEAVYMHTGDEFSILYESNTIRISTRKLAAWLIDNSYEYDYVKRLIEGCLAGKTRETTGRKYSFGDCLDWYADLAPDADCIDPEKHMEITVTM
jgi:hypothetical protein